MGDSDNETRGWRDVRFRPKASGYRAPPVDAAQTRFVTGVVVLVLIALAYPWYSYRVTTWLAARDLQAATAEMTRQANAASERMNQQIQAQRTRQQVADTRRRIAAVRMMGATPSRNGPVVIVRMEQASLAEAEAEICRQAARWLGGPVDGKVLRVQRYRDRAPALDIGGIAC